ncbi:hypothetical protein Ngar_c12830 [Candidatus Nitrososphaera gargensis Ga9.2]|uniref:Uncharacterized protein n=1 Tax=Nitrososphaera gargensis (strain Ga9.2) TaxID=1237085 RepID=K0IH87_NITGG|nr:hypothetical protein [Candidatus Nitrososphaera gargensis]AFU58223.1 hypothetical protein Ngar_c12830 [Candidatus Nitrososphaera gargensis Ga9.2]
MTNQPNISIEGLKEKYRINEPIAFSITIRGVLKSGGLPHIEITKENSSKKKIYSIAFMSPVPPAASPEYVEQKLIFPIENDPQAPIHAGEAGTYVMTVSVYADVGKSYEVNRRILVE